MSKPAKQVLKGQSAQEVVARGIFLAQMAGTHAEFTSQSICLNGFEQATAVEARTSLAQELAQKAETQSANTMKSSLNSLDITQNVAAGAEQRDVETFNKAERPTTRNMGLFGANRSNSSATADQTDDADLAGDKSFGG